MRSASLPVRPGLSVRQCGAAGVLPAALPLPATLPALLSVTLSPALLVYLCGNVGPQSPPVVRLPAPFVPHSASLGPPTGTGVLSAQVPISDPPTGLNVCLFFIYLVSDFLGVRFSVSSGCARRRSVSTYTAILVPPGVTEFKDQHSAMTDINTDSGKDHQCVSVDAKATG